MTPSRVTNSETKILLIGVLRGDRCDSIQCRASTSQSVSSRICEEPVVTRAWICPVQVIGRDG